VFSGKSTIEIDVREPTSTVRLHAENMTRLAASARQGERALEVSTRQGPDGGLELTLSAPLEPGPAVLSFEFDAPLPEVPVGLYRVAVGDNAYAYTQFEPLEARKAFVCFDEPGFKTPFATTLRVPAGMVALSNGPEARRSADPTGGCASSSSRRRRCRPTWSRSRSATSTSWRRARTRSRACRCGSSRPRGWAR
jgi:aminopeptidase N